MMRAALQHFHSLLECQQGSMVIETAILAPTLLALSLGSFEVASMVVRQTELQTAAAEAASIVRAAVPEDTEARTTIRDVAAASAGLTSDQVSIVEIYRCGTETTYQTNDNCTGSVTANKFVRLTMTDTYTPLWTEFGVGSGVTFNVSRTVQIG
jgi:Flp pilus assembly protein TadG